MRPLRPNKIIIEMGSKGIYYRQAYSIYFVENARKQQKYPDFNRVLKGRSSEKSLLKANSAVLLESFLINLKVKKVKPGNLKLKKYYQLERVQKGLKNYEKNSICKTESFGNSDIIQVAEAIDVNSHKQVNSQDIRFHSYQISQNYGIFNSESKPERKTQSFSINPKQVPDIENSRITLESEDSQMNALQEEIKQNKKLIKDLQSENELAKVAHEQEIQKIRDENDRKCIELSQKLEKTVSIEQFEQVEIEIKNQKNRHKKKRQVLNEKVEEDKIMLKNKENKIFALQEEYEILKKNYEEIGKKEKKCARNEEDVRKIKELTSTLEIFSTTNLKLCEDLSRSNADLTMITGSYNEDKEIWENEKNILKEETKRLIEILNSNTNLESSVLKEDIFVLSKRNKELSDMLRKETLKNSSPSRISAEESLINLQDLLSTITKERDQLKASLRALLLR